MALLIPSGTNSIDVAIPGTYRQDISDLMLAPLYADPSFLGTFQSGEDFSGNAAVANWNEEALNPSSFPDTTSGGQPNTGTTTTLLFTAQQANAIDVNNYLADTSADVGGIGGSEKVQVISKGQPSGSPATVLVTVQRAVLGTSITTHDQGAVWQVTGQPIGMNSDLGPDRTLPRVPKFNYLQREDMNVNLGSEIIDSSLANYTPGIGNEFTHQMKNRILEKMIIWNVASLYGIGAPGDGTAGVTSGNGSTFYGAIPILNGVFAAAQVGAPTTSVINFATQFGVGQAYQAVNYVNALLYQAGVRPDLIVCGTGFAGSLAQAIPQDQIRMVQDETTRGFSVRRIMTILGNELDILVDPYISNANGAADVLIVDSGRYRMRPYMNEYMTLLTSPSFRDGDAARIIMKLALEWRNVSNDVGQAHYLINNVSY